LAFDYGMSGLWRVALLIIAFGGLWLFGQHRNWGWVASVVLVCFVAAAASGFWLGLPAGWMLAGVVVALVAWDLAHFARRLRSVERAELALELERSHLRRLIGVAGAGLLLAGAALLAQVRLSFGVAFLVALIAVLGLSQLIGRLRRESV
jgi:hypothetical protein